MRLSVPAEEFGIGVTLPNGETRREERQGSRSAEDKKLLNFASGVFQPMAASICKCKPNVAFADNIVQTFYAVRWKVPSVKLPTFSLFCWWRLLINRVRRPMFACICK